jgi:uncharacterized protein (DUF58 family)
MARAIPAFASKLPLQLTSEAARLGAVLPHLVVEARNVAVQLQLGIHGRRRPGPGEEFWEFRQFMPGESAHRVDWRRSARDDRLYVREREWESASVHWLWVDLSPSMHFSSSLAMRPKRDRALVIALALADLLVHAGERVGLLGRTPPMASRVIISRLAEAIARVPMPESGTGFPPDTPIRRQDHVILVGDFIMPMAEFAERLARLAHRGARGTVVLVRDPAEESFPFHGELEFEGMESLEAWRVGEADEVAARYLARIASVNAELQRIAIRHGFGFVRHVTDKPPAETLLALAALIGGQVPGHDNPRLAPAEAGDVGEGAR